MEKYKKKIKKIISVNVEKIMLLCYNATRKARCRFLSEIGYIANYRRKK